MAARVPGPWKPPSSIEWALIPYAFGYSERWVFDPDFGWLRFSWIPRALAGEIDKRFIAVHLSHLLSPKR